MKKNQWDLKSTLIHVKKKRKVVEPNLGFFAKLVTYEKKLFGKNSIESTEEYKNILDEVSKEL